IPSSHPVVQKIHSELAELMNAGKTVEFMWCPGHIGITGNEEADKACRAVTSKTKMADQKIDTCPKLDLKKHTKEQIRTKWSEIWTQSTARMKKFIKTPPIRKKRNFPNRREQVIWNRLLLGHTRLSHEYI